MACISDLFIPSVSCLEMMAFICICFLIKKVEGISASRVLVWYLCCVCRLGELLAESS